LGKGRISVEKDAHGLKIDPQIWSEFWSSLSHVVRNAVDHGLEDEVTRKEKRKEHGVLSLESTMKDGALEISIGDNGSGIDWEAIAQKAETLGIPHQNEADLLNVLLSDGFSTKSQVSSTSGRGVGLAAVKQAVEKLSGRIEVESKVGEGTAWKFIFPSEVGSIYQEQSQN
jgi:two-component system chemotaxis sensor kinase CheA